MEDNSMETMMKNHTLKVLRLCRFNITYTAEKLEISRATLFRYLAAWNINVKELKNENRN